MALYVAGGLVCLGVGLIVVAYFLKVVDPEGRLTTPRSLYKPAVACIILGLVVAIGAYGNAHSTKATSMHVLPF